MEQIILIKYGELSTKKGNRKQFIKLLEKNILKVLKDYPIKIKFTHSRMYIYEVDLWVEDIVGLLSEVFGIHSIVIAYKVNNIKDTILNLVEKNKNFKTFKVITKRANKSFPIKSPDYNKKIGSLILKNTNLTVDVHSPDLLINIEIRSEGNYIYFNEIKGLGGYPVGIQGKGLLLLSGGLDSPVAGYLALKRGIDLECIYFDSPPHTSLKAKKKVIDLANILNKYSFNIKVHVIPFTKIQETIYKNVPLNYNITILRRMMYRIAMLIASKNNCPAIITGESIGQVASQTLSSLFVLNNVTNYPIIRPVACFDKIEIIKLAKKIKTYEISILPYEDCCTLFIPKHPVINPLLDKCIEYEKTFPYNVLIEECISNIETIELNNFNFKNIL